MIRIFCAALIVLTILLAGLNARADSIVIDGKVYTNVRIHETSTRYYVRLPDGSAISVDKSKVQPGDIVIGEGPLPSQATRDKAAREAEEKKAAEKAAAEAAVREAETQAAREAAEKAAADQARREADARAAQEAADKAATERAQREAAEKAAREAAEKAEQERAARETAERAAKEAQEKAEKEAAERQAAEQARREAEAKAQRELAARQAAEQAAKEAAEKAAQDRAAREAAEQTAREATEKAIREAAEREAAEQTAREATEKAIREAAERAAAEQAAKEAAEMAAQEAMKRAAAEQAAKEAAEKAASEAAERAAAEKAAKEAAERATKEAEERAAAEKAAREALEKAARDAADRETAEQAAHEAAEREVAEKAARDAAEKAAREAAGREAAEKAARDAAEQAAHEAAEREAAEKAARDTAEKAAREAADREAAEKAARDAAEKAVMEATDREAAEKVARDAAEKAAREAAERAAVEKAAREAAEQAAREAAEREAAEKAEQERLEREEAIRRAIPVTTAYTFRTESTEAIAPDTPVSIHAGAAMLALSDGDNETGLEINTLVLKGGETTLAFCTVDLASVDSGLQQAVSDALAAAGSALTSDTLFLSATGVYTSATRGVLRDAWLQPRFGFYNSETAAALAARIAGAVLAAESTLAPAQLRWAEAEAPDCHAAREGGNATTDSTLGVLLAETLENKPVAILLNYAISPPVAYGETPLNGRGVPGETARLLREHTADRLPVLFTNAAAGDVALKVPAGAQNNHRDAAIGWVLAGAALAALETAEPRDSVQIGWTAHTADLPPALLAHLQPAQARIREIYLDEAAFLALPGIPAAQIGMLLRVKGYSRGLDQIFLVSQCGEGAIFHPAIEEYFAVTPHTRLSGYGPLMISWFGAHYLDGSSDEEEPVWASVPILNRYASAFRAALDRGERERETIQQQWERALPGLDALAESITDPSPETDALKVMLDPDAARVLARQLAAEHVRGQFADFTEEQRVILMGVAQGAGLPFDAIMLLQMMVQPNTLPKEAARVIEEMQIAGYDFL